MKCWGCFWFLAVPIPRKGCLTKHNFSGEERAGFTMRLPSILFKNSMSALYITVRYGGNTTPNLHIPYIDLGDHGLVFKPIIQRYCGCPFLVHGDFSCISICDVRIAFVNDRLDIPQTGQVLVTAQSCGLTIQNCGKKSNRKY